MPAQDQPSLIVRQHSPPNMEFPFASLSDRLVPSDLFFVRNRFPSPGLDAREWRLRVDGAVERPLELDLDAIKAMARTTFAAVLELRRQRARLLRAGEGGAPVAERGRRQCGVDRRSLAGGAEESRGQKRRARGVAGRRQQGGRRRQQENRFARQNRVCAQSAAQESDRRRRPLGAFDEWRAVDARPRPSPARGRRRLVRDGVRVKWITHVKVLEQPFLGYWQARDYFRWEREAGEPLLVPLTEMEVKAQIARPANGANLIAGQPFRIFGAAWSGEAPIRRVEVSTGDGEGWREARLIDGRTSPCVAFVGMSLDPAAGWELPATVPRHRWPGARSARTAAVRPRELRRQLDRSGRRGRRS